MSDLSNITKYAQGRNIDAAVDAAVNGEAPKSAEAKQEATVAAQPATRQMSNATKAYLSVFGAVKDAAGAVRDTVNKLSPRSDASELMQGDKVASLSASDFAAVRDGLGGDASRMSDADLKLALGSDVIAQIGKEGFPREEVNGIQKEFEAVGMDKVAALQTYVEACSAERGQELHLCDQNGETVAKVNPEQVLAAAGFSKDDISQALGAEQQQQNAKAQEKVQVAEAAVAEMSMG